MPKKKLLTECCWAGTPCYWRTWKILSLEIVFWSSLTIDWAGSSASKFCPWENLAPENSNLVRIFGLQQRHVSNFSFRNHVCSLLLWVYTFAYHHQISGKSYYLFLQRDTIWGGLAVKRKLSTLAFIKQASHCGHPKYMLGNFTKRSWCRSVWTLFWHCKQF